MKSLKDVFEEAGNILQFNRESVAYMLVLLAARKGTDREVIKNSVNVTSDEAELAIQSLSERGFLTVDRFNVLLTDKGEIVSNQLVSFLNSEVMDCLNVQIDKDSMARLR
ncbi:MAG: hypothetical protein KAT83_04010 [Candidatus Aenigmarchaeota archaeon]|nr:hypothetical protein [Candidatus Aenigmarchaeota archaeon]